MSENFKKLFTSESVSSGHPDKIADQISDALLDEFLKQDKNSKVAIESLVTTGQVVVAGEVKSKAYVDVQKIVRKTINDIGYIKSEYGFTGDSCGIFTAIHEQSSNINQGVVKDMDEEQGAGDQGIMFGYACNETSNFISLSLDLSHKLLMELEFIRKNTNLMPYLRPDAKSQVTVEYDENNKVKRINTIVLSTQHDEYTFNSNNVKVEVTSKIIKNDIKNILIPRVIQQNLEIKKYFDNNLILYVNPTGKFIIGGPTGDTGLSGRKIIVDTYGGKGAHGGGAFSSKDPSKVDRSAAYIARYIAKNLVAAGVADEISIQLSYAIGVSKPISINVNTFCKTNIKYNDEEIAEKIEKIFFELTPYNIIKNLKLLNPIYLPTATYGHFGRTPYKDNNGIEYFTWEKLDYVDKIKKEFDL